MLRRSKLIFKYLNKDFFETSDHKLKLQHAQSYIEAYWGGGSTAPCLGEEQWASLGCQCSHFYT